jgi:glycosyltransferase involved in cell wall biosynthesis
VQTTTGLVPAHVSVVVPVFRDTLALAKCCEAILSQSYGIHNLEVLVVDNSEPREIPNDPSGPIRVLHERKQGSYAARNRAIVESHGDILAFTDADCIPDFDWIREGVHALTTGQCAVVGGRIIVDTGSGVKETAVQQYQRLYSFDQRKYISEGFTATANMFTWRHVFDHVGLFDEHLLSGGDAEWGKRASELGYKPCYSNAATVIHPARRTLADALHRARRITGGHFHRLRKNFPADSQVVVGAKGLLVVGKELRDETSRILVDPRVASWGQRTRLLGVIAARGAQCAVEFIRLGVGGRPVR